MVITPVPVHAVHGVHVPVAEERNVLPAEHVGRDDEEEEVGLQARLDPEVPDCV